MHLRNTFQSTNLIHNSCESRRSYLLLDLNSYFKKAQYADATVSLKEMRNTQHKRWLNVVETSVTVNNNTNVDC